MDVSTDTENYQMKIERKNGKSFLWQHRHMLDECGKLGGSLCLQISFLTLYLMYLRL